MAAQTGRRLNSLLPRLCCHMPLRRSSGGTTPTPGYIDTFMPRACGTFGLVPEGMPRLNNAPPGGVPAVSAAISQSAWAQAAASRHPAGAWLQRLAPRGKLIGEARRLGGRRTKGEERAIVAWATGGRRVLMTDERRNSSWGGGLCCLPPLHALRGLVTKRAV